MNTEQFEALYNIHKKPKGPFVIRSHEFSTNSKPRTLLYGYCADRSSLHVYLYNRHVHMCTYGLGLEDNSLEPISATRWFKSLDDLIPTKRLYPECCDFDFCVYLKERGVALPFTRFKIRPIQDYYGRVPKIENENLL